MPRRKAAPKTKKSTKKSTKKAATRANVGRPARKADAPPDPKALTAAQLADVLTRAGGSGTSIDAAAIERDIEAGAPTNGDGTLHMLHYCAWLAQATSSGG